MNTFCYLHLSGEGRDAAALTKALREDVVPAWQARGIAPWGIWAGVFGVASNELIVMAAGSGEREQTEFTGALSPAVGVSTARTLLPTVRPLDAAPCERPGLYVFRTFLVSPGDVDEVARLSAAAWETFETSDAYASEPHGLFRPVNLKDERVPMLLVTWYDSFASWETSRRPAPEATENFLRRRELTFGTRAIATRLLATL
jgi:hypothetical protein